MFLLLAALLGIGGPAAGSRRQPERHLLGTAALHRELVQLVQGGPTAAAASPALCAAHAEDLGEGPSRGLVRKFLRPPAESLQRWFFGSGFCTLAIPPDLTAILTRATKGFGSDLVHSPHTAEHLRRILADLAASPGTASLAPQQRLMLHSTVWEVGHAIDEARQVEDSPQLRAASCAAFDVLEQTAYTPAETALLPALPVDAPVAEVPEAIDLARRIAAHDSGVIELISPTEAHARLLLGRFTPRVLFTARTPTERERLRRYLSRETPYGQLGELPLNVGGAEAVILLFFNVVSHDLEILPTPQLAFWQQYSFSRQLDLQSDELTQADATMRFVSIRYQRSFDGSGPRYRRIPEDAPARLGFIDAMPPEPGASMTTLRGSCLRCHRRVISSFHPKEKRSVRFTGPLEVASRELLTPSFHRDAEPFLARWALSCRTGSRVGGSASGQNEE